MYDVVERLWSKFDFEIEYAQHIDPYGRLEMNRKWTKPVEKEYEKERNKKK